MPPTSRELYDAAARDAARVVIGRYSTSFSLAAKLLGPRVREHVRIIYALVRVADEIVDGPGREACADATSLGALVRRLDQPGRASVPAAQKAFIAARAAAGLLPREVPA